MLLAIKLSFTPFIFLGIEENIFTKTHTDTQTNRQKRTNARTDTQTNAQTSRHLHE